MIHIICGSSQKFPDFHYTFAWHFPPIKTFQHRITNHKAWSFWPGMRFDTLVQLLTKVGFITAFFRICFYLIYLIFFCGWLQVILMICRSSFTRITVEFYIILMIAFSNISCFSKLNLRTFLEITIFNLFFNCTSELVLLFWDTSPLILFACF